MGWFDFFKSKPDVQMICGPTLDRVIVHTTWRSPKEISQEMPGHLGLTRGPMILEDGEYHAYITAPKPKDFNDHDRIETLGHEFFHALGARHD